MHRALFVLLVALPASASEVWHVETCADIRAALHASNDVAREGHRSVRIEGDVHATPADTVPLLVLRGDAVEATPLWTCAALVPARTFRQDNPIAEAGLNLNSASSTSSIDWDLNLRWDPNPNQGPHDRECDQLGPTALLMIGNQWAVGPSGGAFIGGYLAETGRLAIRAVSRGNTKPPWPEGRALYFDPDQLLPSRCSTVGVLVWGSYRENVSGLRVEMRGESRDTDDVGLLQVRSWGRRYVAGGYMEELAVALWINGNGASTYANWYIAHSRGAGIFLGAPETGGAVPFWRRNLDGVDPFDDAGVQDLQLERSVIEGSRIPVVAFTGGAAIRLRDLHLETRTTFGRDNVLVGAGTCSVGGEVCRTAGDCTPGEACRLPSRGVKWREFWMEGQALYPFRGPEARGTITVNGAPVP